MKIAQDQIADFNKALEKEHSDQWNYLSDKLIKRGVDVKSILSKLRSFQVAIPSWALGTGGTRFGRFPGGGEPRNLVEKIEDIGLLHSLNRSSGAVSLHIPWDIPENYEETKEAASTHQIVFDAMNSNTFQDQEGQSYSYKYGSLSHTDKKVRDQAIQHNLDVIEHGIKLGSKSLTVWLADGSNFPGQVNFRKAQKRTLDSLSQIYERLPKDWKLFIEYKPYEPNFYSTVIQDWGTSFNLACKLGEQAFCLVDLGHHLPNTNIEQIVSTLMMEQKLGGFHFNDSKYGDDDLTVGSIKPYQLFLIFNELIDGMGNTQNPELAWMIDASHNLKDPMEDLLQSVEAILLAYAQALIVDRDQLEEARESNDAVLAQNILQDAFRTDLRPLVKEAYKAAGGVIDPIAFYRNHQVRHLLIKERGAKTVATGL